MNEPLYVAIIGVLLAVIFAMGMHMLRQRREKEELYTMIDRRNKTVERLEQKLQAERLEHADRLKRWAPQGGRLRAVSPAPTPREERRVGASRSLGAGYESSPSPAPDVVQSHMLWAAAAAASEPACSSSPSYDSGSSSDSGSCSSSSFPSSD